MKKLIYAIITVAMVVSLIHMASVFAVEGQFEYVVPCKYGFIGVFSEGYAILNDYSPDHVINVNGYIDRFGKTVMLPHGYSGNPFKNGIVEVHKVGENSALLEVSYMNHDWEFVETISVDEWSKRMDVVNYGDMKENPFKHLYAQAHSFYEGYAIVSGRDYSDIGSGDMLINEEGTIVAKLYTGKSLSYNNKQFGFNDDNSIIWIRDGYDTYSTFNDRVKAFKFGKDPDILEGVSFRLGYRFDKHSPNVFIARKSLQIDGKWKQKWGAFDSKFNLVIPFEYEEIGDEADGIINVKKNGKWGYIDLSNNTVIDFQFDNALQFTEGRGSVCVNGLWGVIRFSDDGVIYSPTKIITNTAYATKIVINDTIENAYSIGERIYLPITALNNYTFEVIVNASGNIIEINKINGKYKLSNSVLFEEKESYSVYETEAKIYIKNEILPAVLIDNVFAIDLNALSDYGAIWEQDAVKHVIFDSPYLPNEGITWEWVEFSDDLVTQETYQTPAPEYPLLKIEGRIPGSSGRYIEKGTCKYYDENDNVILDDGWDNAGPFIKGTALVNKGASPNRGMFGGKWGLIDTEGNYIVDLIWDSAYRDNAGNIIIGVNIDSGEETKLYYGLTDKTGNILIPIEYSQIRFMHDDKHVAVENGNLLGVLDFNNQVIFPFNTHDIYWDDMIDGYMRVYTDRKPNTYRSPTIAKFIEKHVLQGSVLINGEKIEFDNPPMIVQDRTIVPVRKVFEKMGFDVKWNDETQTAIISRNDTHLEITQGKNSFLKNGAYIYSDVAPINFENSIYLPLRAIAETIGCTVNYDDVTGEVIVEY